MTRRQDYYELEALARYYDWQSEGLVEDIPFYVALSKQHGSPVVEVGCGTGRLTIPLAREGMGVVGLDLSPHMLAVARRKIENEASEVKARIELVEGDMRDFNLGRTFPCVFVPQAAVFHLDGREALLRSLANFHRHTKPGGLFLLDVVSPDKMKNQKVGEDRMTRERIDPDTHERTREFNEKLYIDPERQVVCCNHRILIGEGDRERRIEFQQEYRWIEAEEAVGLFHEVGFTDVKVFGDYAQGPFTKESSRLILQAKRDLAG